MVNFNDLRAGLTDEQREILNTIWRYEIEHDRAIPSIALCDSMFLDQAELRPILARRQSAVDVDLLNSAPLSDTAPTSHPASHTSTPAVSSAEI
jgi:hypothetical protein